MAGMSPFKNRIKNVFIEKVQRQIKVLGCEDSSGNAGRVQFIEVLASPWPKLDSYGMF